jgi:hypothetical protein
MDGRSFSAVLLSGVLTGSELTSWAIVHPSLWKLEHKEQVRAEKLVYKRFGSIDPFLMRATTAERHQEPAPDSLRHGHFHHERFGLAFGRAVPGALCAGLA